MKFVYDDGGRSKYFKATNVGDCVTRAICNATGKDYKEVYDALNRIAKSSRKSKRERGSSNSRNGVHTRIAKKYIENELGWQFVATMGIGTGCQVHLTENELPKKGCYILNLSHHFSCIKDGVLYDTYDCSRDGTRCVYGYWKAPTQEQIVEKQMLEKMKELEKQYLDKVKQEIKKVKTQYSKKIKELEKQQEKKIKEIKAKYGKTLEQKLLDLKDK